MEWARRPAIAASAPAGGSLVLPALKLAEFEPEVFGYSAGRLTVTGDRADVRLWPRCLMSGNDGDRLEPRPSHLTTNRV